MYGYFVAPRYENSRKFYRNSLKTVFAIISEKKTSKWIDICAEKLLWKGLRVSILVRFWRSDVVLRHHFICNGFTLFSGDFEHQIFWLAALPSIVVGMPRTRLKVGVVSALVVLLSYQVSKMTSTNIHLYAFVCSCRQLSTDPITAE